MVCVCVMVLFSRCSAWCDGWSRLWTGLIENHHENKYFHKGKRKREDSFWMWEASSMGWALNLNKNKGTSWVAKFISVCFLTVGMMSLARSHSCHHAFPATMTYIPTQIKAKIKSFFFKLLWHGQNDEKR